jgi:hypothetical protein
MKKQSIFALLLVMLGSILAFGQGFNGSIVGRVQDQQQAVVPNATVILRNEATGVERRTQSDKDGDYTFLLIPPGKYVIQVDASGFASTKKPVEVTIATALRADITLGVQGAAEAVTIAATGEGGVAVQTEAATLGNTVSTRQVIELPTIGRNAVDFVQLSAGATPSNDGRGAGFSINGQRAASGNFVLDGGENNDTFVAGVGQQVPLDAVQEFRLQTNNYNAEYGRNAGFIANIVTKSGTSQYHGNLYWFLRNSALAANTFDNNANGAERPVFNRNQFGGTFGGPLTLPRLGEGGSPVYRNKTNFFFVSVEPIIIRSSAQTRYNVPTPQLIALAAPGTQAIFQRYPTPTNYLSTIRRNICRPGTTCDTANAADPNTLANFPIFGRVERNGPRDAGAGTPQNTVLATGRVDFNLSEKTQLFARYAFEDDDQFASVRQAYTPDLDQPFLVRNNNILLNLTRTWSSQFVTESRVVYNRIKYENPLVPKPSGFPGFVILTESVNLPSGASSFGGPQNLYQFFQTATWVKGDHNIKFGGQYIHLRDNRTFGAFETAEARFTGLNDFLRGVVNRYTIAINPKGAFPGQAVAAPFGPPSFTRHFRYNEPAVFIQDTWKIHPRVTLTPGVRYEYYGVLHSPENEKQLDANFYYGAGANILERIANGRFLRAQDAPGEYKNHLYKPDRNDWSPRMGIAWDIFGTGKTAFRSGVGIFYDRNFGNVIFNVIQNPPNYGTVFITNVPVTPALINNQYAAFPTTGSINLSGTSARHLDQDLRTAYTASWNATLEHELANKLVVGATYVGASGVRLYTLNNINRFDSGRLLPASFNRQPGQRLNTGASSINTRGNSGHSSYHSLQLKADSRYLDKVGLVFGANYTWSHSIDNNSSFFGDDLGANPTGFGFLNAFNPSLDRGDSDFDARHRMAVNFNWDIPVAKNASNYLVKNALGGWQLSGIFTFQTGQPFSIFDSGIFDFTVEATRPLLTGPLSKTTPNRSRPDSDTPNTFLLFPLGGPFYDADFNCVGNALKPIACDPNGSVNGPFRGNMPRNVLRRPGTQFHNLNLLKNIAIREGWKLQVRAEFYNVFNHQNAYLNFFTNDIASANFNGFSTPGVTLNYGTRPTLVNGNPGFDSRQVVMALKLIF